MAADGEESKEKNDGWMGGWVDRRCDYQPSCRSRAGWRPSQQRVLMDRDRKGRQWPSERGRGRAGSSWISTLAHKYDFKSRVTRKRKESTFWRMHSNSFDQTFNEESLSHKKEEEKGDGGVLAPPTPPALFSSSFPYSVCCYSPFLPR